MIVEYKMNMSERGYMIVPPWVENCGYFFDDVKKTYIGFVSSEANREFYVPDTITYLTIEEVKQRVYDIPMRNEEGGWLSKAEKDVIVQTTIDANDLG